MGEKLKNGQQQWSHYAKRPRVSFTKLCDASYPLTHGRSHELILLMNCYTLLWAALHRVTPCVASCIGTQESDVQTRRTNIFVKDPQVVKISFLGCTVSQGPKSHFTTEYQKAGKTR